MTDEAAEQNYTTDCSENNTALQRPTVGVWENFPVTLATEATAQVEDHELFEDARDLEEWYSKSNALYSTSSRSLHKSDEIIWS